MVVLHHAAVVQDLTTALAAMERGVPALHRPQARSMVLSTPWAGVFAQFSPAPIPQECFLASFWVDFSINLVPSTQGKVSNGEVWIYY